MKPKQGMLAICSQGYLGLITSKSPVEVTHPSGGKCLAWTGIHLGAEKFGEPWSSLEPRLLPLSSIELARFLTDLRTVDWR